MRRLRDQQPFFMAEEERHNLLEGLVDIRYVRDFLNVVGPEERARFDERDTWGYGDPTYMGGDVMEVFESQLKAVVHTLFGAARFADEDGDGLKVSLHHASVALDEDDLSGSLARVGGGPVEAECVETVSLRKPLFEPTLAERFAAGQDVRGRAREGSQHRPRTGPGRGAAAIGLAKLNATGFYAARRSVTDVEELTALSISGSPHAVADLEDLLHRGAGEGEPPVLYRWRAGSTPQRMLGGRDALVMLCGEELCGVRPFFHDIVFSRLLAAWSLLDA